MRHRTTTIFLSLLLVGVLLLTGTVAAQDKVKVVIFVGLGTGTAPGQIAAQEALAERFNSSHDRIEIEFLIVPVSEAGTRLLTMLTDANTAPQLVGPNGISTIATYLESWADIDPFIEAEGFDTSDFYPTSLELNDYPDKNTGLPLGLFPSFIIYNVDAFDIAGVEYPPSSYDDASWTIDELRDRAMRLTLDANYNNATDPDFDPDSIIQWGFDDSWISARGKLALFGAENVGRPTNGDYTVATANDPAWVRGLQWISDAIHVDRFMPGVDGVAAYEATGFGTPLDGGMVAMFHTHTWYLGEIADFYDQLAFEMQLAPVPINWNGTRVARIHADNFTMPAIANHKEEAWEVMKWLTSAENIIDVCLIYGCIPARMSVADAHRAMVESLFPGLDLDIAYESINYLDSPNHESWVPQWGRVEDIMGFAYEQIFLGANTDAQAVLDEANAQIQAILDEYNAG
jgi:multiple sugar transport system substrate-binding protein